MKHVIIGTAGHVDHGKTALIKALTGVDTDRLAEEKKRGITIELGFSHLEFPDGIQAGIVDVPGHEKFIKNMLSGAGGMDLAMLVVAADEGVMPQTEEHLQILSLLGVRRGLFVLTKTDLVDKDWLELLTEDLKTGTKGTFLENWPVVPVSVVTGDGLDRLRQVLHDLAAETPEKDRRIPFRLPIDRVFSAAGFGTIVTGTLMEGVIRRDETADLVPSEQTVRVRSLQVHGKPVQAAYAGQRVAVNLAGIAREQIRRGESLCKPGSMTPGYLLDVRLKALKDAGRSIASGSRVHLHHGAGAALAKVILLDRDTLEPGQEAYAQLRLSEPMAAKRGDPFVIRFYSPVETIGGGVILDAQAKKHKRGDQRAIDALHVLESGSEEEKLLQTLKKFGWDLPDAAQLEADSAQLAELCSRGKITEPLPGQYLSTDLVETLRERCTQLLERYHETHPLHVGMSSAELRQKLLPEVPLPLANAVLRLLEDQGALRREGDRAALPSFAVHLTHRQNSLRGQLLAAYGAAGWKLPTEEELVGRFAAKDREDCRRLLDSLLSAGELVRLSSQLLCSRASMEQASQLLEQQLQQAGSVTLGGFRDALGSSRDTALLVLEYFDRKQRTRRQGNVRVPYDA